MPRPPEVVVTEHTPVLDTDAQTTARVAAAHRAFFGADHTLEFRSRVLCYVLTISRSQLFCGCPVCSPATGGGRAFCASADGTMKWKLPWTCSPVSSTCRRIVRAVSAIGTVHAN